MPAIAEELLLLLLDNASAQPALDPSRRRRALAGAVLLDLAYGWRLRPTAPDEPVPEGRLIALAGPDDGDPTSSWAWRRLARKPLTAKAAVAKLERDVETRLLTQLEHDGLLQRTPLYTKRFRRDHAWLLTDRNRAARVRSQVLRALVTEVRPAPETAGVITVLHAVAGLDELLSFDSDSRRWVSHRAAEITRGSWVAADSDLTEVNLAVMGAKVRAALR